MKKCDAEIYVHSNMSLCAGFLSTKHVLTLENDTAISFIGIICFTRVGTEMPGLLPFASKILTVKLFKSQHKDT